MDTTPPPTGDDLAPDDAFYYDTRTGAVEQGRVSSWAGRMGPYRTRAEAERALDIARARTAAWDEADRRDRDG